MRFSIVTPNLNQGAFLWECLESVWNQSSASSELTIEHRVMDGGSSDESLALLEKWKEAHQDTAHYSFDYTSGQDQGQSDAINRGMRDRKGDVLAYLCADDFYEVGAFDAVAGAFKRRPEVEVVYGDYFFLEGRSGWKRLKETGVYSQERLFRDNFLSQPAVFWRRSVWERHGEFDVTLRYCMDYEYWLRIAKDTVWEKADCPLATARLHGGSKTGAQLIPMWDEVAAMSARYGLQDIYRLKARKMRRGGAFYYQMKRRWLERWGRVRRWLG
jgi:glycosyltransferase involved in cell wall biosynthesis